MKVLLLTWDYPPAHGGIQLWMYELAMRLPDADVHVLAPVTAGSATFDRTAGVRVTRLSWAKLGQSAWLAQLTMVTLVRALVFRPDLIVCGHVVTGPAAMLASRLFGIPYVVFTYAFEIRRERRRRIVTQVLRRASMVVASSRFTQTSVLSLGVSPDRVRILHPGANVAPEDATSAPPSPDRPFTLLSVSRLVDLYKGHDTVIRALPLIHSKCPATRYVIVGGGPLRDYLQRLAGTLGVEQHVVFLGDVSDDTREALYQNCDVFVQLSREARSGGGAEGFGIVCLEASAAGKPVVAGRAGGLPDAVKDGVSGLLVDPSNLGHVAEAIASLLLDSSRRMRMGQAGRARVLRAFTWERMAQTARALFAEAAGAK